MKPDYNLCDVCGKPTKQGMFVPVGSRLDGAGDREDDGMHFDLCLDHAFCILQHLLYKTPGKVPNYELGLKITAYITDLRRGYKT